MVPQKSIYHNQMWANIVYLAKIVMTLPMKLKQVDNELGFQHHFSVKIKTLYRNLLLYARMKRCSP